jgi:hypothetical protein
LKSRPAALLARDVVADLPALAARTAARRRPSKQDVKNKKMSLLTHNRRSAYDNDS